MPAIIDYFYSHLSPWAYMGHQRLLDLAATYGAEVHFKPVDSSAVFSASGGLPLPKRPIQRRNYRLVELERWRDATGLPLNLLPKYHPAPDRLSAQVAIAATHHGADFGKFSLALMQGCWVHDQNLADAATLEAIANGFGLDGKAVMETAESSEIVERLDSFTEQANTAGIFGMPWYIVDDEPFWGQDRLDFVETKLAG